MNTRIALSLFALLAIGALAGQRQPQHVGPAVGLIVRDIVAADSIRPVPFTGVAPAVALRVSFGNTTPPYNATLTHGCHPYPDDLEDTTSRLLIEEELWRNDAYRDPAGRVTIGIGHLVDRPVHGKISDECVEEMFQKDKDDATAAAMAAVGTSDWERLNEVRRAVLTSMAFQMGPAALPQWITFLKHIHQGNFRAASQDGMNTLWARQTPERAQRQMRMLATGEWVKCRNASS